MKHLQIAVKADDWDGSSIYAVGRELNGRQMVPQRVVARELPEPWIDVWRGLVEKLRGVAPGEWAATLILASLTAVPVVDSESGEVEAAVELLIHRKWDDKTTAPPLELVLEDAAAVAFFHAMTGDIVEDAGAPTPGGAE